MENLKRKTANGFFWAILNSGIAQILNLLFGIFLARLLVPEDYGLVGLLTVFTAIASTLQTSGLGTGLINLKQPTDNDYNAVFWFNVLVSLLLYVLMFACMPIIAAFFSQPRLVLIGRVLFLTLPLYALSSTSGTFLQKNLMNREIAIVSIISIVISGLVGVMMAFHGFSYWSLVGQQMTSAIVTLVGRRLYVSWRPSLRIDFTPIKRMFGFCMKLLITNMVYVINNQLLTFIFGRLIPIKTVGYYSQANKWNNMARSTIGDAVWQISQPVLVSIIDEHNRELRAFRKMLRFTSFLSFPALWGLALVAEEFILFTIGDKWVESVPLLRIICIGGAFMPFYSLYASLVLSNGRSDIHMWCHIGQMVIQIVLVLVLFKQGIEIVLWSYSTLTAIWLLVWHYRTKKLIGISFLDLFKDTVPFMAVTAVVIYITYLLTLKIISVPLLLLIRVILATLLYAIAMKLLQAQVMKDCVDFLFYKKSRIGGA